jgi:monofunctional biosynthetic peptidoglycan transglycosylase
LRGFLLIWVNADCQMIRRAIRIIGLAIAAYVAAVALLIVLYTVVPPISTLMLLRWVTGERVVRDWRPIQSISPNLVHAVVVSEDARICAHSGVDWQEVRDAIADADELADARGASTIAMQTARNLFLWPGRQLVRKAMEVPIAYAITLVWSKRRIVEVYLNIAQWGPTGEFGAEAAAQRAFRKSAASLSRWEAGLLAASLPNPVRRNAARPGPGLQRLAASANANVNADGGAAVNCLGIRR